MSRILVTGGAGSLGREIVARLKPTGNIIRIMSRSPQRPGQSAGIEWAQADLETGVGVTEAVKDVNIIINATTNGLTKPYQVDVVGAGKMLEYAKAAGVAHVIHISIVGIDRINFGYYKHKLEAEEMVKSSGVSYSILRATQFHTLPDIGLGSIRRYFFSPLFFIAPDAQLQLIDPGEVAEYLIPYVSEKAVGRIPDVGGPEILTMKQVTRMWLEAQGLKRPTFFAPILPMMRGLSEGFQKGYNTCPQNKFGKITWADYLRRKYGAPAGAQSVPQKGSA